MNTIYYFLENEIRRISIKEFSQVLRRKDGYVWIDLEDPSDAEEETLLVSLLDFHPLAIEDCQRGREDDSHLPKVEDFDDYLFVIFNPVERAAGSRDNGKSAEVDVYTTQLSAFLMKRVLVTHHYKPLNSISNACQLVAKNPMILGRGPDFFFHLIIDHIVDGYTPILDAIDDAVDEAEAEVFRNPTQRTMIRILALKRVILTVRRIATYQREMLNRLSRGEFRLITQNEVAYYRNVYDHLVRTSDLAESYRDMVGGLLDAYLSVTSNRLSQVMKVLTIISTIFLPLSFITGFFGMNFAHLPGLESVYGVIGASTLMLAVAVGMLWAFRKRKWL